MKPSKPLVSDVVSMRALEYSTSGSNVTISLTTKYSSERFFSVPVSCLSELISDLEGLRLRGAVPAVVPETQSNVQSNAVTKRIDLPEAKRIDLPEDAAAKPADNQVNITVPKKWMLVSGLPNHPLVFLILDPQTKAQTGFGFGDKAAREMATGLVKYADLISSHSAAAAASKSK